MPFKNQIVGGGGQLILPAIRSPNFQEGVSGWSINQDGSAEFHTIALPAGTTGGGGTIVMFAATKPLSPNPGDVWYNTSAGLQPNQYDGTQWQPYEIGAQALASGIKIPGAVDDSTVNAATFTGSVFEGTDFIINAAGAFYYSGTPGAGNLAVSIAQADGTDQFGNKYYAGFVTYGPGGSYAQLVGNPANNIQPHVIFQPPTNNALAYHPQLVGAIQNAAAANEYVELALFGGNESGRGGTYLVLAGDAGDGSTQAQAILGYMDGSGNQYGLLNAFRNQLLAQVPIAALRPGTSTPDTWQKLTPVSPWAWTGAGNWPVQCEMVASPPNTVLVKGDVTASSAISASPSTIATLPSGYFNTSTWSAPAPVAVVAGTLSHPGNACIQVDSAGEIRAYNCQGATRIAFNFQMSLDGLTS